MKIAVWFSCGAASAVAAKYAVKKYGTGIRVVNNPVAEEDEDNRRFLKDIEKWIGVTVETAINPAVPSCSAEVVWKSKRYMSGIHGAPCTFYLKKAARQYWETLNGKHAPVLGFTADEARRAERFRKTERKDLIPILVEEGITKADCFLFLKAAGIKLPRMYAMGYPNANCIGCVKATSPTYWNHVRRNHPQVFQARADLSRELGVKLTRFKGKRISLDQLPENATGRPLKGMSFECGIFCEESPR